MSRVSVTLRSISPSPPPSPSWPPSSPHAPCAPPTQVLMGQLRPSNSCSVLGPVQIPARYSWVLQLALTHVLVPHASFTGHMCGVVAGLLQGFVISPGARPDAAPPQTLGTTPATLVEDSGPSSSETLQTTWMQDLGSTRSEPHELRWCQVSGLCLFQVGHKRRVAYWARARAQSAQDGFFKVANLTEKRHHCGQLWEP